MYKTKNLFSKKRLLKAGFKESEFDTWPGYEDGFLEFEFKSGWLIVSVQDGSYALSNGEDEISIDYCLKDYDELQTLINLLGGSAKV